MTEEKLKSFKAATETRQNPQQRDTIFSICSSKGTIAYKSIQNDPTIIDRSWTSLTTLDRSGVISHSENL